MLGPQLRSGVRVVNSTRFPLAPLTGVHADAHVARVARISRTGRGCTEGSFTEVLLPGRHGKNTGKEESESVPVHEVGTLTYAVPDRSPSRQDRETVSYPTRPWTGAPRRRSRVEDRPLPHPRDTRPRRLTGHDRDLLRGGGEGLKSSRTTHRHSRIGSDSSTYAKVRRVPGPRADLFGLGSGIHLPGSLRSACLLSGAG